jgi:hypothetical protein
MKNLIDLKYQYARSILRNSLETRSLCFTDSKKDSNRKLQLNNAQSANLQKLRVELKGLGADLIDVKATIKPANLDFNKNKIEKIVNLFLQDNHIIGYATYSEKYISLYSTTTEIDSAVVKISDFFDKIKSPISVSMHKIPEAKQSIFELGNINECNTYLLKNHLIGSKAIKEKYLFSENALANQKMINSISSNGYISEVERSKKLTYLKEKALNNQNSNMENIIVAGGKIHNTKIIIPLDSRNDNRPLKAFDLETHLNKQENIAKIEISGKYIYAYSPDSKANEVIENIASYFEIGTQHIKIENLESIDFKVQDLYTARDMRHLIEIYNDIFKVDMDLKTPDFAL